MRGLLFGRYSDFTRARAGDGADHGTGAPGGRNSLSAKENFCSFLKLIATQHCQVMDITKIPINILKCNKNLVTMT
jgi:hypothetical protein